MSRHNYVDGDGIRCREDVAQTLGDYIEANVPARKQPDLMGMIVAEDGWFVFGDEEGITAAFKGCRRVAIGDVPAGIHEDALNANELHGQESHDRWCYAPVA